jgi:hypothetical protein
LLPPDSSGLFENGKLQEHNFAESSFAEDEVGTSVTEFDLTNADTSSILSTLIPTIGDSAHIHDLDYPVDYDYRYIGTFVDFDG